MSTKIYLFIWSTENKLIKIIITITITTIIVIIIIRK